MHPGVGIINQVALGKTVFEIVPNLHHALFEWSNRQGTTHQLFRVVIISVNQALHQGQVHQRAKIRWTSQTGKLEQKIRHFEFVAVFIFAARIGKEKLSALAVFQNRRLAGAHHEECVRSGDQWVGLGQFNSLGVQFLGERLVQVDHMRHHGEVNHRGEAAVGVEILIFRRAEDLARFDKVGQRHAQGPEQEVPHQMLDSLGGLLRHHVSVLAVVRINIMGLWFSFFVIIRQRDPLVHGFRGNVHIS
mmetsp:Transcript_41425/g.71815  ORF Transcript_41425/g.71815 Transcript_41425/m.71815 type:complete len:247 (+) Transcript_41425:351-1091(+)